MRYRKVVGKLKNKFRPLKRNILFLFTILKTKEQRKYTFKWIVSLRKNYLQITPSPWITFGAIDYLESFFKTHQDIKVFEYGSGGSTFYWLSKGSSCVSIEHDPGWFKVVNSKIKKKESLDYRLILPDKRVSKKDDKWDFSDPKLYLSSENKDFAYEKYVKQIEPFQDNFFDIVLIDGRARPSCIYQSFTKVKPGGLIILDNADRLFYLSKTKQYLENYKRLDFYGVVPTLAAQSLTAIFQRLAD